MDFIHIDIYIYISQHGEPNKYANMHMCICVCVFLYTSVGYSDKEQAYVSCSKSHTMGQLCDGSQSPG